MVQGEEFKFQREATTNLEREQGTEGGQKREHADDGMPWRNKRYTCSTFPSFEQAQAARITPG
jgi:hypothetical protein